MNQLRRLFGKPALADGIVNWSGELRMMCTQLRSQTWTARVIGIMGVGLLLLLDVSWLEAQTMRPPSRALPGLAISHQAHSSDHFADAPEPQAVVEELPEPVAVPEEVFINPSSVEIFPHTEMGYPPENIECDDCWQDSWIVPNMFGDFFDARTEQLTIRGNQLLNASPNDAFDPATLGTGAINRFVTVSPGGSVVARQKVAENNSPLPQNRVYLNYDYVSNVGLQTGGVGVHRFSPGFERTFLDDLFSLEFRLPMAMTYDSDSFIREGTSRDQAELGNVYLALKGVLWTSDRVLISGGLGSNMPTADSLRLFNANTRELVRVENEAFHLLPFLAGAWSDGGFFFQGFLQGDVDLNGNPVAIDNGQGLRSVGDFHDASYLYLDLGLGYWLIKNRHDCFITGIAPTAELHYNTALDSPDTVRSPSGIQIGGDDSRVEMVNLLFGATFQLAGRNTFAIGYGTPAGGDKQFDGELRILLNWYYGGN